MSQKEIKRYLSVIKKAVSFIEVMLDNDDNNGGLLDSLLSEENNKIKDLKKIKNTEKNHNLDIDPKQQEDRSNYINYISGINHWPEAVPQFLTIKEISAEDQVNRANAVLDMVLDKSIEGLNFLDFGCGEGWIAEQAVNRGVLTSTGYDIERKLTWKNIKNVKFTDNFNELKKNYYDIIILYDVLDHCLDPVLLMSQIKSLIKNDGIVYVRCHPWVSKHATHLYKQGINKSYFHLFLNYEEIKKIINSEPVFVRIEKNPVEAYHWWFNDFNIIKERFVKEPVSDFFHAQSFKEILSKEQNISMDKIDEFLQRMEIQFVDYKLQLN